MKIKVSEASGAVLDWLVAKCRGIPASDIYFDGRRIYRRMRSAEGALTDKYITGPELLFSSMWESGGPIIDRINGLLLKQWLESKSETRCQAFINDNEGDWVAFGPTALIAAMRCYVIRELGEEVEVPEELLA